MISVHHIANHADAARSRCSCLAEDCQTRRTRTRVDFLTSSVTSKSADCFTNARDMCTPSALEVAPAIATLSTMLSQSESKLIGNVRLNAIVFGRLSSSMGASVAGLKIVTYFQAITRGATTRGSGHPHVSHLIKCRTDLLTLHSDWDGWVAPAEAD